MKSRGEHVDLLVLCTELLSGQPIFPRRVAEAIYGADLSLSPSDDSIPTEWPAPGKGCITGARLPEEDFRDEDDEDAPSFASYNSNGKKIHENGNLV